MEKNRRIVFIGDCDYNTGPSNVNKDYKRFLDDEIYFLKHKNKLLRAVETVLCVINSKVVIISGRSKINNLAIAVAKIARKKTAYIMHGCYKFESQLTGLVSKKEVDSEQDFLKKVDLIIAVSEHYMKWAKEYFPEHRDKMTFVNNGIDWECLISNSGDENKNEMAIVSAGGGNHSKRNIVISDAVNVLNEQYHIPFCYTIVGREYTDGEKLRSNKYTKYLGQINHEQFIEILKKSTIYIQNSVIESFGVASMEALSCGCNLLVSKNVGAQSIMTSITADDIIENIDDPMEIANKIMYLSTHPNNERLLNGIDKINTSCECSSKRLLELAKSLMDE